VEQGRSRLGQARTLQTSAEPTIAADSAHAAGVYLEKTSDHFLRLARWPGMADSKMCPSTDTKEKCSTSNSVITLKRAVDPLRIIPHRYSETLLTALVRRGLVCVYVCVVALQLCVTVGVGVKGKKSNKERKSTGGYGRGGGAGNTGRKRHSTLIL